MILLWGELGEWSSYEVEVVESIDFVVRGGELILLESGLHLSRLGLSWLGLVRLLLGLRMLLLVLGHLMVLGSMLIFPKLGFVLLGRRWLLLDSDSVLPNWCFVSLANCLYWLYVESLLARWLLHLRRSY